MGNTRRKTEPNSPRKMRPAKTLKGRENQMVSLAVELAEQQLRDGTASAQVITHYLKLGSSREILEQQRIQHEIELQKARVEAIESQGRMEELYSQAITAMRMYTGQGFDELEDDYYD